MIQPQTVVVFGHELVAHPDRAYDIACKYCPFSEPDSGSTKTCRSARQIHDCTDMAFIPVETYAVLRLKGEI